jgi:hypothetical protein
MTRFFRAFEISTEYGEMKYSNKPLIHHLPKLIKGWVEYQFLSYYFTDVPKWRVFVRKLFSTERIAPDYVMTGPSKGGSSDLVSHLLLHPNVMHPLVKEVRLDNNKNWRFHYPTEKEKQQLMKKNGKRIRCGYLDPTLNRLSVMNTLYDLNPECKVIITLRNPVARAYSYWKWEVFRGGERLKNNKNGEYFKSFSEYIERALDLFPSLRMETVTGGLVLENGIYYKAVEHWINRFGRENVLVLDVAEYFSNRQPTLEKIQKFLDLPVVNIPEYGKKANENPIKLPPPEQKTKSLLAEFYQPYNQKLFDLIETEFNWQ